MSHPAGTCALLCNAISHPSGWRSRTKSARHHGHAGWREGGETHFRVLVVAACFSGRSRIERQRLVHAAAGELLRERIHALSITALAPGEPIPQR